MKILVIGSGGREHALVWALARHADAETRIYCAPGNAGIGLIAENVPLAGDDWVALAQFAHEKRIDLTIAGSETTLAAGIADYFAASQLAFVGPVQAAARLEASKAFAKEFMTRHRIPTARYRVAANPAEALRALQSGYFGTTEQPIVVKADGLAAGKGVIMAAHQAAAEQAMRDLMISQTLGPQAARRIVLEETLSGREVSLLLFSDGRDYALMPPARDHKRIGEGDTGPNTGGMGAITAPHLLDEKTLAEITRTIVEPTLRGAAAEGFPFRGILFIGLMLTPDGPRVLEYNVRFGDPETQALMVRLKSDFRETCRAVAHGRLAQTRVAWTDEASACVVLAAPGYPARPRTGDEISGLGSANQQAETVIFHAGTARTLDGSWCTAGGRVLGVTSTGADLATALRRSYQTIANISWDGMQYRRDIGGHGRNDE